MAYSPEQWERARAYYEAGVHSLSEIQKQLGISKSKISERAKKEQWERGGNYAYIEAKVKIAETKRNESSPALQVLDDISDEVLRNKNLVFGVTQKALKKIDKIIETSEDINDMKTAIEASDRASITLGINPRHASQKIEVNNTNAVQIQRIERVIVRPTDPNS